MSTALERPLPVIRLFGPPGLVREIASSILDVEVAPATNEAASPDDLPALIVLVDPGRADWDAAVAHGAPVVLVTGRPLDAAGAAEAILRGADAVVHDGTKPVHLLEAVQVLLSGGTLLDPSQARALAVAARAKSSADAGPPGLTERERQILASIARGDAVKQTAIALGIKAKTVENLQGRLFCKLGVRNRAQAVTRAHELGLLARPDGDLGQTANDLVL